jgi:hypothetical protein
LRLEVEYVPTIINKHKTPSDELQLVKCSLHTNRLELKDELRLFEVLLIHDIR